MLSRWKLLKVIVKSHFHYLCGSREVLGKDSNKISDESFIFESNGIYYVVSLVVTRESKAAKRQGGAE